MKETSIQSLKSLTFISLLIFCHLTSAEQITVDTAYKYPYKNLINRTDIVKVFYIKNGQSHKCRVEVVLNKMKWTSVEKEVNKDVFNKNILANCLSSEKAEKILFQTFLQFGQGL